MTASLCAYLAASVDRVPDRPAVIDPSGRALRYGELDRLSGAIAGFLAAHGVGRGDRVGVVAPKSADAVAALFGIMKAGAAYVPADYSAPPSRTRTLLQDCGVKALFLYSGAAGVVHDWAGPLPEVIWMGAEEAPLASGGTSWDAAAAHPVARSCSLDAGDLAYILYTSGSTGVPKGVTLTHGNATSFVDWCSGVFDPAPDDRFSSHAPFHFDLSILDLYVALKHGAAVHLVSEDTGKNPRDLAAFIEARRLTVWYSTPSILGLLAQFGGLDGRDCSSLRVVCFAGEVFPVKHLRAIVSRWPQAEFFNLYGPTETNVCTFARVPTPIPPDRVDPYPIGDPCAHCAAIVLDAFDGEEVPRGEEGLLHIAGPSLFSGYWNRPDAGLFFTRHGRRWYNTGDVVREEPGEGYVYIGRRDRMVKRRGYRIELGEIEKGVYLHDGIREAAAIAVPDGDGGVRIVVHLVPRAGARPSIVELKTFCGRVLPSYMNPDVFVFADALPRTSTDKVDYQELQRSWRRPAEAV